MNKPQILENVLVVVRAAGERTEDLCVAIAAEHVGAEHIKTVHEKPFSKSVRRSFEVGIAANYTWTACLDADILLRQGALADLVEKAHQHPADTFCVQGKFLDMLFRRPRPGGPQLYRTALLPIALEKAQFDEHATRPESYVKEQMAALGYHNIFCESISGLHDYEQYYVDIFRKSIVHAQKHRQSRRYLEDMWRRLAPQDPSYAVALLGLYTANALPEHILMHRDYFPQEINEILHMLNLEEKAPLIVTDELKRIADQHLQNYQSPPEVDNWMQAQQIKSSRARLLRAGFDNFGFRAPLWFMVQMVSHMAKHVESNLKENPKTPLNPYIWDD